MCNVVFSSTNINAVPQNGVAYSENQAPLALPPFTSSHSNQTEAIHADGNAQITARDVVAISQVFNGPISFTSTPPAAALISFEASSRHVTTQEQAQSLPVPLIQSSAEIHYGPPVREHCLHNLPGLNINFFESHAKGESKTYFRRLHEQLFQNGHVAISGAGTGSTIIAGMGGIGKTQLALAYANKGLEEKQYDLIWWIKSETDDNLNNSYSELINKLFLPSHRQRYNLTLEEQPFSEEDKKRFIQNRLRDFTQRWLLVYDNVPISDFLKDILPIYGGHVIITSRDQEGWDHAPLRLDVWSEEQGLAYLKRELDINDSDQGSVTKAKEVTTLLGGLPLALNHAARYIQCTKTKRMTMQNSLITYIHTFKVSYAKILSYYPKGTDYPHTVGATWLTTYEQLLDPAKELLHILCYLNPEDIPLDTLARYVESEEALDTAINELTRYGMLTVDIGDKKNTIAIGLIHRLVLLVDLKSQFEPLFDVKPLPDEELIKHLKKIEERFDKLKKSWQAKTAEIQNKYKNPSSPVTLDQLIVDHKLLSLMDAHEDTFRKHIRIIFNPILNPKISDDTLRLHLLNKILLLLHEEGSVSKDVVLQTHFQLNSVEYSTITGTIRKYYGEKNEVLILRSICSPWRPDSIEACVTKDTSAWRRDSIEEKVLTLESIQLFKVNIQQTPSVLKVLQAVPVNQRKDFCTYAQPLIKTEMGEDIEMVLGTLFFLPANQREVICTWLCNRRPYVEHPLSILEGSYDAIYKRFLEGILIYRPYGDNSDKGRINMYIRDLVNPLEGIFNLSRCGDAGEHINIFTGYRKDKKSGYKREICLTPMFVIERDLATTASHYQKIMRSWDTSTAPIGVFWNMEDNDLEDYDYFPYDARFDHCNLFSLELAAMLMDGFTIGDLCNYNGEWYPQRLRERVDRIRTRWQGASDTMAWAFQVHFSQAVADIPANSWSNDVYARASPLIQPEMEKPEITRILQTIADIPSDKWSDIYACANPLIKLGMSGHDIGAILGEVGYTDEQQRRSVCTNAQLLIQYGMKGSDVAIILQTIADIPSDKWVDVYARSESLIQPEMSGHDVGMILWVVNNISADEWDDVHNRSMELTSLIMKQLNVAVIFKAVADIDKDERESVCTCGRPLIQSKMDGYDVARILKVIDSISTDLREGICLRAQPQIQLEMKGSDVARILQTIVDTPAEQR